MASKTAEESLALLFRFYKRRNVEPPRVHLLPGDRLPEPYRRLLRHNADMTHETGGVSRRRDCPFSAARGTRQGLVSQGSGFCAAGVPTDPWNTEPSRSLLRPSGEGLRAKDTRGQTPSGRAAGRSRGEIQEPAFGFLQSRAMQFYCRCSRNAKAVPNSTAESTGYHFLTAVPLPASSRSCPISRMLDQISYLIYHDREIQYRFSPVRIKSWPWDATIEERQGYSPIFILESTFISSPAARTTTFTLSADTVDLSVGSQGRRPQKRADLEGCLPDHGTGFRIQAGEDLSPAC